MVNAITLPRPAEELCGKRIKFRILASRGDPVEMGIALGEGVLIVDGPNDDGCFEAFIRAETFDGMPGGPGNWTYTDICLDQRAVDCLKIQEDGSLLCLDAGITCGG